MENATLARDFMQFSARLRRSEKGEEPVLF